MTYVALAAIAALVLSTSVYAGHLRAMLRSHARERDLMLNQIMHLAGRTWAEPPSHQDTKTPPEEAHVYAAEQDPDY